MSSLPPITWPEVREVRRLMLDEEWTLHGDESLVWQPWVLPVHIGVYEHGQYSDGFPSVSVKAWTRVAEVADEDLGVQLAEMGNGSCPMATFFYDGSLLVASCGVSLNADGRTNLALLHTAALAMTTAAHELAAQAEAEGIPLPDLDDHEAKLGRRQEPDELLDIFAGEGMRLPGAQEFASAWQSARPLLAGIMASTGYQPGFTDPSVDFYNIDSVGIGVGLAEDAGAYGDGLRVLAIVWTSTERPYPEYVTDINRLMGARLLTNVGNADWADSREGWGSLRISANLPYAYLGESSRNPHALAIAVFNTLMQIAQTAKPITPNQAAASRLSAV